MFNFKWLKRNKKPVKKINKKLQKTLDEVTPLDQTEVKMLDEKKGKHSFDMTAAMKQRNKRRAVDMLLFKQVKRALQLKKSGKFYKTEQQIADKFRISQTTVALMRQSRSFSQYRELRRRVSGSHGRH